MLLLALAFIPCSFDQTVTEEEIASCRHMAQEIEDRLARKEEDEGEEFLIYKPEQAKEANVYIKN